MLTSHFTDQPHRWNLQEEFQVALRTQCLSMIAVALTRLSATPGAYTACLAKAQIAMDV